MEKHEKLMETLAKYYAALQAGVTLHFVNMALRGERDSNTAETVKAQYRKKLKDLKQCLALPSTANNAA